MRTRILPACVFVWLALVTSASAQGGWVPYKINTGGNDLNTVYFLDSKRGWVGGDSGFLSRTDDGGQNWTRQVVATTAAINDIYFRDKEAGFLIAGNTIFVTRDNGSTWSQSRIFSPEEFEGSDVELMQSHVALGEKNLAIALDGGRIVDLEGNAAPSREILPASGAAFPHV